MNRLCIKQGISILFLLFSSIAYSQNNSFDTVAFYNHLLAENLYPEQIAFNNQLLKDNYVSSQQKDSLYLNISIAYCRLGYTDSVNATLSKISPIPVFSVHASGVFLSLLILNNKYDKVNGFIATSTPEHLPTNYYEAKISVKMLMRQSTINDTDINKLSPQMLNIKTEYEHPPHHSAFLAGLYSAVLPGMGKLYLGYGQEALSGFVANAALGTQAAESYFRAGPNSARFILSATLFGLFYGGNIWGSIVLAKKQKRDHLKQVDYEIYNYYNSCIGNSAK